ncbi:ABC transporter ATP-binding protein [Sulfidibacter corallicola]|uniref:ABC transporter ATP-binding protein n=1 Tax=Sulfidibacter corallicola TaxID=2818388 RepID=A0A8A4TXA0_SULCO|nr:ABC transporter ATP-binding protein [Sulfidibacter corallicola]QTD53828.1 ABC transporter ATP-binding protein [Sulfidibacter corallicola]
MIKVDNLSLTYGRGDRRVVVLRDLSFHLNVGEFVTIVGRSGSGKSTFLDLIMGLIQPTSGTIERRKKNLSIGYVFQRPALLPWRNVLRNIYLPLQISGISREDRRRMAMEALEKVGMGYAAHYLPFQLSGGMAQRVAIARALVQDPDLLLMDEPFSALDPMLRENMNVNLLRLWQRTGKTILFVTHSIDEALILSDRIVLLEEGKFLKEFEVDIPRPRGYETFRTERFTELNRIVRAHLPIQPNMPRIPSEDEDGVSDE